jgi:hypothetical protein
LFKFCKIIKLAQKLNNAKSTGFLGLALLEAEESKSVVGLLFDIKLHCMELMLFLCVIFFVV